MNKRIKLEVYFEGISSERQSDISVSTRANYLDIKESARMALNILDDS